MEHFRGTYRYGLSLGDSMEMEVHCTGCDLVDFRGATGNYMLSTVDVVTMGSQEGRGSVLVTDWVRPEFGWPFADWPPARLVSLEEGTKIVTERRPAGTIGELDIHLGFVMQELKDMRERVDRMMAMLATKEELAKEIAALRAEIQDQAPKTIWKNMTGIAIGVTSIAGAFAVVVAVFRYLHL